MSKKQKSITATLLSCFVLIGVLSGFMRLKQDSILAAEKAEAAQAQIESRKAIKVLPFVQKLLAKSFTRN
jgi:hypothetical protein